MLTKCPLSNTIIIIIITLPFALAQPRRIGTIYKIPPTRRNYCDRFAGKVYHLRAIDLVP